VDDYRLVAKAVSLGMVTKELPDLRRYRFAVTSWRKCGATSNHDGLSAPLAKCSKTRMV